MSSDSEVTAKASAVTKGAEEESAIKKEVEVGASNEALIQRRRTRTPRQRKSIYQTEDLIREISPQPERLSTASTTAALTPATTTTTTASSTPATEENNDDDTQKDVNFNVNSNNQPQVTELLNGKRTVQCNICKRQMTESKLANHIRLLHVETSLEANSASGKRKGFKCEYCGKLYALKYTYQQHIRTHTEGRPKCPECGSTFASAFSLFRHRAKNHNLEHNYTTHSCDQCDKSFFSISELKLHQQRHSPKKEFNCTECKKAFSVKGNLRIHMRTHAKEKLYKCDICENSFSHPYSLVSHRRIHTNDFPFKCSNCGKVYRSKHQLTSHMNVHSDNRPFKCNDCSKTFRSRTAFKMHQDEHQGIKRFSCKFCNRQFQCHGNKSKHERRHIGDKKHKCQICDKAFIEKQELKNHLKVHERHGLTGQKKPETSDELGQASCKETEQSATENEGTIKVK